MAGSFEHILDGWSLIENMGDAHEATEELMWLVLRGLGEDRAKRLLDAEYYPMVRGEANEDQHYQRVQQLMEK